MSQLRVLSTLLRRVKTQISMVAARCVVNLVDDSGTRQVLQIGVLSGEVRGERERFQEYGFSSVPFPGAEGIFLCPQGDREQGIVISVEDRRHRLTGQEPGESAHHDEQGQKIQIQRVRILVSTPFDVDIVAANINLTATTKIAITAPIVDIQGKGNYEDHAHDETQPGEGETGGVV